MMKNGVTVDNAVVLVSCALLNGGKIVGLHGTGKCSIYRHADANPVASCKLKWQNHEK